MKTVGIILVVIWAIIGVLSPVIGYVIDKVRGMSGDSDSKISTGYHDTRVSSLLIVMYSLPLLFVGLVLNYFGSL